jgi:hypothetical protein
MEDNTLRAWNAICRADGVDWDQLLEALREPYVTHRDDKNSGGSNKCNEF